MYLQDVYSLSDDAVVGRWVENRYFRHFTGQTFFQHTLPIHPSSLSRWRGRICKGDAGSLLNKTIMAGRAASTVNDASLWCVAVGTTVVE